MTRMFKLERVATMERGKVTGYCALIVYQDKTNNSLQVQEIREYDENGQEIINEEN